MVGTWEFPSEGRQEAEAEIGLRQSFRRESGSMTEDFGGSDGAGHGSAAVDSGGV